MKKLCKYQISVAQMRDPDTPFKKRKNKQLTNYPATTTRSLINLQHAVI